MPLSSVVERAPEGKGTGARFGLSEAGSVDEPRRRGVFDLHLAFVLVILWLLGAAIIAAGVAIIASPYLIERAS